MELWLENYLIQVKKTKKKYLLRKEHDEALDKARTETSRVLLFYLPCSKRRLVEIKIYVKYPQENVLLLESKKNEDTFCFNVFLHTFVAAVQN